MITIAAFFLLVPATKLPLVPTTTAENSSVTHPRFFDIPKDPNGLTLYNEKGEVVARCRRKGEIFDDCTLEPGVTLDDLMNAWVHAYLDVQK